MIGKMGKIPAYGLHCLMFMRYRAMTCFAWKMHFSTVSHHAPAFPAGYSLCVTFTARAYFVVGFFRQEEQGWGQRRLWEMLWDRLVRIWKCGIRISLLPLGDLEFDWAMRT